MIVYGNSAHHRMFGYADDELNGVCILDLVADDGERDELKRYLEYLVREQPTPTPYLTQVRAKDGRVIDVQIDWTYKRDGQGQVVGFVFVITEITERKEAEERIRGLNKELQQRVIERTGELDESRRTFETLMKNLPGTFYRCRNDKNWSLEFADEGSAALTGYPVEKLLAGEIHYSDLMHVDDRERVWTEVQRAVAAYRPFQLEYRIMPADGTQKWVLERGCAIRAADGSVEALEGVLLDVTDRKRAEEELRLAAQITANMVEGIIIVAAADGKIVYTNRRFEEMFGYGSGEIVGRPITIVNAPGDRTPQETAAEIIAELKAKGRWSGEIHNIKKDRTSFWTYANISTFEHRVLGPVWLTVQQDITDRKNAEARTWQHQAESAHFQRLATLGEMASGLAHEVNQPLAAIANYAAASLRTIERDPTRVDKIREDLANIGEQAHRAGDVVHRLRRLVRREPPHRSTVAINDLVREVLRLSGADASARGVTLRSELAEHLPNLQADHVQIEQVILNVVRNAIDATCDQDLGVREVVVATAADSDCGVLVTVRDTGHGLPDGNTEHVFEPFATTKPQGLGLGLSISRSIVEVHGGSIRAARKEGGGAVFSIRLPHGSDA